MFKLSKMLFNKHFVTKHVAMAMGKTKIITQMKYV